MASLSLDLLLSFCHKRHSRVRKLLLAKAQPAKHKPCLTASYWGDDLVELKGAWEQGKVRRRPWGWIFCFKKHFPSSSPYSMNRTAHMAAKLLISWALGVRISGKLLWRRSSPGAGLHSAGDTHFCCFTRWHTCTQEMEMQEMSGIHKRKGSLHLWRVSCKWYFCSFAAKSIKWSL